MQPQILGCCDVAEPCHWICHLSASSKRLWKAEQEPEVGVFWHVPLPAVIFCVFFAVFGVAEGPAQVSICDFPCIDVSL